jgi:glucose-1-phosphate cytidylyltransferase
VNRSSGCPAKARLHAWRHERFWQSVDTLRDKRLLNDIWNSDKALWKLWRD